MGVIRYVALSDLHLGALDSLLTNVRADGEGVDPSASSPVTETFGAVLRGLRSGQQQAPQLVVLGDLLELALTPMEAAAYTLRDFLRSTGLGHPDGAFDRTVRYVAGNHDHYLWSRARTDHDQVRLEHAAPGDPPPTSAHVTSTFPADHVHGVPGRYVVSLARWADPSVDIDVVHSYPNLGLTHGAERAVVLHHGHFVERLYRIVSALDEIYGSDGGGPRTAKHLERDNAGWIDFFWSSEGDSGDVGSDIRRLYESLVDGRAAEAELARITDLWLGNRRGPLARIEAWTARRAVSGVHRGLARRERHLAQSVLSEGAEHGLSLYLEGTVRHALVSELGRVPSDLTFVFGHTHKPFSGTRAVDGYPQPVRVVNTGGWVVDHEEPEPIKGATAVLIDDECRVVALRLFQQQGDGTAAGPQVTAVGAHSQPFADEIRGLLTVQREPWAAFTAAVTTALRERRRELRRREADVVRQVQRARRAGSAAGRR